MLRLLVDYPSIATPLLNALAFLPPPESLVRNPMQKILRMIPNFQHEKQTKRPITSRVSTTTSPAVHCAAVKCDPTHTASDAGREVLQQGFARYKPLHGARCMFPMQHAFREGCRCMCTLMTSPEPLSLCERLQVPSFLVGLLAVWHRLQVNQAGGSCIPGGFHCLY